MIFESCVLNKHVEKTSPYVIFVTYLLITPKDSSMGMMVIGIPISSRNANTVHVFVLFILSGNVSCRWMEQAK